MRRSALASCESNDTYRVTIEYTFNLVTPILSGILGSGIDIGTEANAVVFSDALSFGDPLPEESTDPGPTVGPPGECLVPNLIGLKKNNTDDPWVGTRIHRHDHRERKRQLHGRGAESPVRDMVAVHVGHHDQLRRDHAQPGADRRSQPPRRRRRQPLRPRRLPPPTPVATPTPTPTPPTCRLVPTLEGFTVSAARAKWTAAGFTGPFSPSSGPTNKTVITQTTNPPSIPGDCIPANSSVTVTHS